MKPRLKLRLDGTCSLITAGESGLSELETRRLIKAASGSVLAHCQRFRFEYTATIEALTSYSRVTAGKAAQMRRVLGLPVHSSQLALAIVAAQAAKRHAKKVTA